jgi:transmembrane sensor
MTAEERVWQLVSRKLAGEASAQELNELEGILSADKELATLYRQLAAGRIAETEADQLNAEQSYATHFVKMQLDRKFDRVLADGGPTGTGRKTRRYRKAVLLSTLIILFGGGIVLITRTAGHQNPPVASAGGERNQFSAKKGVKSRVRLADGTEVLLNGDSRISYNNNFQGATREVELSGEAFFDVVRDGSRPFIIHTAAIDLTVLGTSFNVRSYVNEKNTEASLLTGSLEVSLRNNPDKKIILKPSEKLVVSNSGDLETGGDPGTGRETGVSSDRGNKKEGKPSPVMAMAKVRFEDKDSLALETSWTRGSLEFDEEDLEVIAHKIERWYDVDVVIKNDRLRKRKFTGIFENKSLEQVVEALQLSRHFNYTLQNKELVIY